MTLTGVWLNAGGVLLAGVLGSFIRRGMPEKLKAALMTGLGLCVLYIGISGISADTDTVVLVLSVSLGMALGTALDLDGKLSRLGELIQQKLPLRDSQAADGFVSSTLFVCVGAMSIVGGIESGTQGTYDTFLAKTFIDSLVVFVMAATKGIGCCLSAFVALFYQAALTLSAGALAKVTTGLVISQMSEIGSLLIVGIALNLLGITKIKVANLILSPFLPVLFYLGQQMFRLAG
ncbi:DUF554 domain-containing protein [Dysosmobacter welbionis]|uniref:DUF554 domain-containing protein n=1 Tax=Dysosmobacter welbionis TaxID=2093857 RepID=UPI003AB30258